MSKPELGAILEYLQPFAKFQGFQLDVHSIAGVRSSSFPPVPNLQKALTEKWKKTCYLSRDGGSRESLFSRLEASGAMLAVTAEETIDQIRCILHSFELERHLRVSKTVSHSEPDPLLQFHRRMLIMLFRHLNETRLLSSSHATPPSWLRTYLDNMHEHMIAEVRCIAPLFPYRGINFPTSTVDESLDDAVCFVFRCVEDALKRAKYGRGRKELALQLTRSICSPSNFFHINGTPSRDAIRKRVERRSKLRTKVPY